MWKLIFSRRDKIRTCGLRSAPVGPGRGPPDLVDPLRPNDVFEPARGRKFGYIMTNKNRFSQM